MKAAVTLALLVGFMCAQSQTEYPRKFFLDGYQIDITEDDSGYVLVGTVQGKEVFDFRSYDGFIDTVENVEINNDGIPDFFVYEAFCDGTELYAYVSKSKSDYTFQNIPDLIEADYCPEFQGVNAPAVKLIELIDLDKDGVKEILLFHVIQNGDLKAVSCSDTVKIK